VHHEDVRLAMWFAGVVLWMVGLVALFFLTNHRAATILTVSTLIVWAMAVHQLRIAQRHGLLALLALGLERRLPLPPLVLAFAAEEGGVFGRRAWKLAHELSQGASLHAALRRNKRVLPPLAGTALFAGGEAGDLAGAMRDAVNSASQLRPAWRAAIVPIFAQLNLYAAVVAITTFLAMSLFPAFERIFDDFRVELPAMTQAVVTTSAHPLATAAMVWSQVFALPLILYAVLRYMGWIRWRLPGMSWLLRRHDAAVVLRSLALAAERSASFTRVMAALADTYPSRSVRRRLGNVTNDLLAGYPWIDSLEGRKLIGRAEAAVLESAQRAGNLPWALREMADSGERRTVYRLQSLVQLLLPVVVVMMGLLVGLIVVGYFLPLVRLITELAR
jgi:protein transport protein HofC